MVESGAFLHQADFFIILDHTQFFHQAVRRLQRQTGFQAGDEIMGDNGGFKADAAGNPFPEQSADFFRSRAPVDEDAIPIPQFGGGFLIAGVGTQPVSAVLPDNQAARAFVALAVVQLEAGKIKTVGRVGDDEGIQPLPGA